MTVDPAHSGEMQLTLRCEIACELAAVRAASIRVREFLAGEGLAEEELAAWELVVVEAGNNAVEHAPVGRRAEKIEILMTCSPTQVELRMTDHTPGFDWEQAGDLPDDDSEGGRGVFLIKTLVDRAAYFRGAGANVLVLGKARLAASAPAVDLPGRIAEQEAVLAGMTEELSSSYEALVAIFRHSTDLGSTLDLRAFAVRLLEDLVHLTETDVAVLRLASGEGRILDPYLVVSDAATTALPAVFVDGDAESAEREAARTRQDVWFGLEHPLAAADPLRQIVGLEAGVSHPFLFHDQVLGTLTLARRAGRQAFGASQMNLLHTFTEFFVIQFGNLRFLSERMEARVVRHDIEIAAEVQRSLLPQAMPAIPPFEVAGSAESAREVGGDLFDVIPAGEHGTLFVIADVMGKGLPAALFASVLRSVVRASNSFIAAPGAILTRVNDLLYDDLSRVDMFATAQLAFLATGTRTLTVAAAGHCPLLICSKDDAEAVALTEGGLPLGVERGHTYLDSTIILPPRSRFMLYTDGVFERKNPTGELFGEQRLASWLARAPAAGNSAAALRRHLAQTLTDFAQGEGAADDQTFLIVSETDPAT